MADIHAEWARALAGVPFRPQGRDPQHGLDCVGLCIAAYRLPPEIGRIDYQLRGDHRREVINALSSSFRNISAEEKRPGDLLMLQVADNQVHLAVLTAGGFVHADARLRRVVETPGEPCWPVTGVFRHHRKKN